MATLSKAFFQAQAVVAFDKFGDIIEDVTYRQLTGGAYNPATGSQTVVSTETSTRLVKFQLDRRHSQHETVGTDDQRVSRSAAIIIQSELSGVTCKVDDEIVFASGQVWRVENVEDVNSVIWQLEIRVA